MQRSIQSSLPFACLVAVSTAMLLSACGPRETTPTPTTTSQSTVPPPPGDSTPKAADSGTRNAVESNEKSTSQSTVGTAASGAPPYTLNGAPEGNPAPAQGAGANPPAKK